MKRTVIYKEIILILILIIAVQGIVMVKMWLGRQKKAEKPQVEVVPTAPKRRIAIVLDDWGYNAKIATSLEHIHARLTMSVLPNLAYSKAVAALLHKRGFEIILHLPLEPHEQYRLEKNTIMVSMNEQDIQAILKKDLTAIPYCRGVSNHMGSKATEDTKTMGIIFNELHKRGLYYLDSFVTSKSVCAPVAKGKRVLFAKRDVFLDNKANPSYIKEQVRKLKEEADEKGYAIGIGHARRVTLETLKEIIPSLEREGYSLVFVSELAE
ncbi:MAG: divergent polysaccharide deacetylase family protein [Candidatus Omnitrophota bacterium]